MASIVAHVNHVVVSFVVGDTLWLFETGTSVSGSPSTLSPGLFRRVGGYCDQPFSLQTPLGVTRQIQSLLSTRKDEVVLCHHRDADAFT